MTDDTSFLTKESLFLRFPPTSPSIAITIDDFLISLTQKKPNYLQLIDYTYFLIKDEQLNLKQLLKVWEIRLVLLLFNNQLTFAKKEAINLNNSLYQFENGTSFQPNQPSLQMEASRMNSMSSNSSLNSLSKTAQPIYPLPKNNSGIIQYDLLILLLRLKSIPNLNLVNDIYKLSYQMRLGATAKDDNQLMIKLINLSYEIIVALSITKNYISLIQFLKSLRYDLQGQKTQLYEKYYSNITLLLIIIEILNHNEQSFEHIYSEVNNESVNCLAYVLDNVSPTLPTPTNEPVVESPEPETLKQVNHEEKRIQYEELRSKLNNGQITGRIICSLLGLWDLSNMYQGYFRETQGNKLVFKLQIEDHEVPEITKLDELTSEQLELRINLAHDQVTKKWSKHIHKVYGLE